MPSDLQNQLQELLGSAYQIESELGGAGMSRVFVATETELDRQVVVKVLPPDLAAGINVDRFRREIQLAAKLQHPHIVPLLAAGAKGSLLYYTMPFIAGENLRARLTRTRELPVQEATRYLREVSDALSYAHAQGVVHRDIKPENIIISGSHALVLDFGVSKALSSATAETPAEGPTLTSLGVALGTPAYMAPEQAAADPNVDARADIYALGVVGYELLAGRTPFSGLNQQQTLAAHVTTAPVPITQFRPQLPPGLAVAIMRCLEKHPSDRWQNASELHAVLEPYTTTSGATAPALQPVKRFQWTPVRIGAAAAAAGLVISGLVASTIAFRNNRSSVAIGTTHQVTNDAGLEIHPAISPDGKFIAYSVPNASGAKIFIKSITGGRPVEVTAGGWPRWSGDGSKIYFNDGVGRNYSAPSLGGVPTTLQGLDSLAVCRFSHAGDRVVCTNLVTGILELARADGTDRRAIKGSSGSDGALATDWSTDDALIAFTRGNINYFFGQSVGNIAPSSVWVVRSDGSEPVQITDHAHLNANAVFRPDGSLLYVSNAGGVRDIYLQRLSSKHERRGEPIRLTTGLNPHTISIDRAGNTVAYSAFTTSANVWSTPIPLAPTDNPVLTQHTSGNQTIESAAISHDGKWLMYDSNINGNQDIFKIPIDGGDPVQLTYNGADNFTATWSYDDRHIAYHSLVHGSRDVYVADADGANPTEVAGGPGEQAQPFWIPGKDALFYFTSLDSIVAVERDPSSHKWTRRHFLSRTGTAAISPDNHAMLLLADTGVVCSTCPAGFFLANADATSPRILPAHNIVNAISAPGNVVWSRDSRHAYVLMNEKDGTGSIWQIPVNGDPERRLVHFRDPLRRLYRLSLDVDDRNFYFTLGDRQSDIWALELKHK